MVIKSAVESNFKVLVSCETVKNFSCFCLDVESLVTYSNNKKADFCTKSIAAFQGSQYTSESSLSILHEIFQ